MVASTGGAAQNYSFVYEGEQMAVPATGTSVARDATASGGQRLALWANRTVTAFVPGAIRSVSLRVKGQACEGSPGVKLSIDGVLVGEQTVTATEWDTITFTFTPTQFETAHVMSITFPNDYSTATCDRNLFLDRAVVDTDLEVPRPSPVPTVPVEAESLSLSPTSSGKVVEDVFSTGDKAQLLWANGSVSMGTAASIGSVIMRVKGQQCAGAPQAVLEVDGVVYATVDVYWTGWATHQVTLDKPLPAASHTVTVRYPNNGVAASAGCDRNLLVDYLGVNVPSSYLRPPPREAESLPVVPAASGDTINDAGASGGRTRMLWSNGRVDASASGGIWNVVVNVRGMQCEGSPQAVVSVDGKPVATFEVWWTTWETVPVKLATPLPAGQHTISVAFTNDATSSTCDRALRVDWLGANLDGSYLTPPPVKPIPKPYNGATPVPSPAATPPPPTSAPSAGGRPKLRWAPPALTNPVTVNLSTSEGVVQLDEWQDYIIRMPSTVRNATTLKGGRNVVVIGGSLRKQRGATLPRALFIHGATGTVHLEGLLIDNTGGPEGDGIAINAPRATVNIVNTRIVGVTGSDRGEHGDLIQPFGGVSKLRIDRMTGATGCQGLFLRPDSGPIGSMALSNIDLNYVNNSVNECGDLIWLTTECRMAPTTFAEVYVGTPLEGTKAVDSVWPKQWDATCPSRVSGSTITFPSLPVTGAVKVGTPPGGPFVPAGAAGVSYTSPGYQ